MRYERHAKAVAFSAECLGDSDVSFLTMLGVFLFDGSMGFLDRGTGLAYM